MTRRPRISSSTTLRIRETRARPKSAPAPKAATTEISARASMGDTVTPLFRRGRAGPCRARRCRQPFGGRSDRAASLRGPSSSCEGSQSTSRSHAETKTPRQPAALASQRAKAAAAEEGRDPPPQLLPVRPTVGLAEPSSSGSMPIQHRSSMSSGEIGGSGRGGTTGSRPVSRTRSIRKRDSVAPSCPLVSNQSRSNISSRRGQGDFEDVQRPFQALLGHVERRICTDERQRRDG